MLGAGVLAAAWVLYQLFVAGHTGTEPVEEAATVEIEEDEGWSATP